MTNISKYEIEPEPINPTKAIAMLLSGLMSPEDAARFRPGQVSVQALIKVMTNYGSTTNRSVSEPQVARYARDMINNRWLWTGDPIRIDNDGVVRDGQHRLLAIVASKKPQEMVVIRGVDPAVQRVIDTGRPRSPRDQVVLAGIPNSTVVTAAGRLLIRAHANRILDSVFQVSVSELLTLLESPDGELLQDAARRTRPIRFEIRSAPMTALNAWYVDAVKIDPELTNTIITGIHTGENLSRGNPVLTLRSSMLNYDPRIKKIRHGSIGQYWQLIRTWNAIRKGEQLSVVRVPNNLTSATFPKFL